MKDILIQISCAVVGGIFGYFIGQAFFKIFNPESKSLEDLIGKNRNYWETKYTTKKGNQDEANTNRDP